MFANATREKTRTGTVLLGGALLVAGCAGARWSNEEALAAESVEMQLDGRGRALEIEYHVAPEDLPGEVRAAMEALHPGGLVVAAEKEVVGSRLFWEVTKEIDGREVEAMFRPDGTLHAEEAVVASGDVPDVVRAAVAAHVEGRVVSWEEIRDGDRTLVEYHAKTEAGGMRYKAVVGPEGVVRCVVREVPAEIEVPLR